MKQVNSKILNDMLGIKYSNFIHNRKILRETGSELDYTEYESIKTECKKYRREKLISQHLQRIIYLYNNGLMTWERFTQNKNAIERKIDLLMD